MRWVIMVMIFLCGCASSAYSQPFFNENFESGSSPFSFSGQWTKNLLYNEGSLVNVGGARGNVWKTIFKPGSTDTYFGFDWIPSFLEQSTLYIRFYVRYGDDIHPYTWTTSDPERPHELKFPDFGESSSVDRIIGKHRAAGSNQGIFRLYTTDGNNHDLPNRLVSNVWYCIEFMVSDNGNNDVVKIWLDKNDINSPNYVNTSSSNRFTHSGWHSAVWTWGYRNHSVASDQFFYFDDVVISNSYIGCGFIPAPPTGLIIAN